MSDLKIIIKGKDINSEVSDFIRNIKSADCFTYLNKITGGNFIFDDMYIEFESFYERDYYKKGEVSCESSIENGKKLVASSVNFRSHNIYKHLLYKSFKEVPTFYSMSISFYPVRYAMIREDEFLKSIVVTYRYNTFTKEIKLGSNLTGVNSMYEYSDVVDEVPRLYIKGKLLDHDYRSFMSGLDISEGLFVLNTFLCKDDNYSPIMVDFDLDLPSPGSEIKDHTVPAWGGSISLSSHSTCASTFSCTRVGDRVVMEIGFELLKTVHSTEVEIIRKVVLVGIYNTDTSKCSWSAKDA